MIASNHHRSTQNLGDSLQPNMRLHTLQATSVSFPSPIHFTFKHCLRYPRSQLLSSRLQRHRVPQRIAFSTSPRARGVPNKQIICEAGASARVLHPPSKPHTSGYLQVSSTHSIYYEVHGNPQGVPALVIHGGPGAGCFPNHASTPRGCLVRNTTDALVHDYEKLRKHLGISRFVVLGGSWGVTLALEYARMHPDSIAGLVLRGVCLMRQKEIDWMYRGGVAMLKPIAWHRFISHLDADERDDALLGYYKLLLSNKASVRDAAAKAWLDWEMSVGFINTTDVYVWNGEAWSAVRHPAESSSQPLKVASKFSAYRQLPVSQAGSYESLMYGPVINLVSPNGGGKAAAIQGSKVQSAAPPSTASSTPAAVVPSTKPSKCSNDSNAAVAATAKRTVAMGAAPSSTNVSVPSNLSSRGTAGNAVPNTLPIAAPAAITSTPSSSQAAASTPASRYPAMPPAQPRIIAAPPGRPSSRPSSSSPSSASSPSWRVIHTNTWELIASAMNFQGDPNMPPGAAQALLECHYSINGAFLDPKQSLLDPANVDKIRHIPCIAVHGQLDWICPPSTAYELHQAWPEMELRMVPNAGHSMYDGGITHELMEAIDRMMAVSSRPQAASQGPLVSAL